MMMNGGNILSRCAEPTTEDLTRCCYFVAASFFVHNSYWRKIVRNKIARMKERRREKAALQYATERLWMEPNEAKESIESTWGPYTTTSGNAL